MKQLADSIRFLFFTFLIGLGGYSCSSEEIPNIEETEVTFMATLQNETDARAIGDGTKVNMLVMEVFDENQEKIEGLQKSLPFTDTSNIPAITMSLVKNQIYSFVFWAYYHDNSEGSIYNVSNLKAISMNAPNTTSTFEEIEKTDAFYAVIENYKVKGNVAQSVELVRPLAQINVGTTSAFTNTTLTVKDVPTVFYPFTGTVSVGKDLTWEFIQTSDEKLEVGENEYTRLAMGYVFAPITKTIQKDCILKIADDPEITTEVTLKANHRSNIIRE